jgi:hypothetical protein
MIMFTTMTHRRPLTHCQKIDRQQGEADDIARTRELHDPTNGDGVNHDDGKEEPWSPTTYLQLDQDDEVT